MLRATQPALDGWPREAGSRVRDRSRGDDRLASRLPRPVIGASRHHVSRIYVAQPVRVRHDARERRGGGSHRGSSRARRPIERSPTSCRMPMARPTSSVGGFADGAPTHGTVRTECFCCRCGPRLDCQYRHGWEVTGSGKNPDHNQGRSWCSFSGLNDDPGAPLDGSGPNGPGGQSQAYGQDVKLGLADPHGLTPGVACNPNRTFLPPTRTGPTDS